MVYDIWSEVVGTDIAITEIQNYALTGYEEGASSLNTYVSVAQSINKTGISPLPQQLYGGSLGFSTYVAQTYNGPFSGSPPGWNITQNGDGTTHVDSGGGWSSIRYAGGVNAKYSYKDSHGVTQNTPFYTRLFGGYTLGMPILKSVIFNQLAKTLSVTVQPFDNHIRLPDASYLSIESVNVTIDGMLYVVPTPGPRVTAGTVVIDISGKLQKDLGFIKLSCNIAGGGTDFELEHRIAKPFFICEGGNSIDGKFNNGMITPKAWVSFGNPIIKYDISPTVITSSQVDISTPMFVPQHAPFDVHYDEIYNGGFQIDAVDSDGFARSTTEGFGVYSESKKTIGNQPSLLFPPSYELQAQYETSSDLLPYCELSSNGKNFNLNNHLYPTTVFLQTATARSIVYDPVGKTWKLYQFNPIKNNLQELIMAGFWDNTYYAARLAVLLDGHLISTAWAYDGDGKTYHLWQRRSHDIIGIDWAEPEPIKTRVDNPDEGSFDAFQPTWAIIQNIGSGNLTLGDYKSNDMGVTWA